ncbi:MAG: heat-inducible transcription repressor HrcA [Deltaproteobacteria bacterium]|nr:heat-inducible transcription repressor HrcA [Deltaproteobacteria bacterium]MBW1952426.1 heat-inducible transcription repressor HrcA [Deltaproteobacteria bacterium]MBW2134878.1 heat-inducible transcription repressor HrcA [Deltaproteobacteria bacterium]
MGTLGERDTAVLNTVITQYIKTGEPVGSRTVAKKSGLFLSPATIRNLMVDLEERGLLTQPHTSAGRIPTPLGFRYYVDYILPTQDLGLAIRQQIASGFVPPATETHDLLRQTSRILSVVSGHLAIVRTPRLASTRIRHIQFINLGGRNILVVLVSHEGLVLNRFIESEDKFSQDQLDKFSRYLNSLLQNLTLLEARSRVVVQMKEEKTLFDTMLSQALSLSQQALQDEEGDELYIEGTSQILDYPEFANIDKMRALFKAFEEKHHLIKLLDRSLEAQGVQVFISPGDNFPDIELSLVASPYQRAQSPVGSLAVVGPMRMDYARVVPVVKYTAYLVSDLLDKLKL